MMGGMFKFLSYGTISNSIGRICLTLGLLSSPCVSALTGSLLNVDGVEKSMSGNMSTISTFITEEKATIAITNGGSLTAIDYYIESYIGYYTSNANYMTIYVEGCNSTLGDLEEGVTITLNAIGATDDGDYEIGAIRIIDGSMGDINGDIIVSTSLSDYNNNAYSPDNMSAYGIKLEGTASLGTISGSIAVSTVSDSATATGIESTGDAVLSLSFAPNASITTASGDDVGTAIKAAAGLSLGLGDVVVCCCNPITIVGDIDVGTGVLNFVSGKYDITANSLSGESITITQGAQIVLTGTEDNSGETSLQVTSTINLQVSSELDCALIVLNEGTSLEGVDTINIQLSDFLSNEYANLITEGDWDGIEFAVIAVSEADAATSFANTSFNITNDDGSIIYASDLSYTDFGFTSGVDCFICIPEPSTALLSVFALTGLLARRRRAA